MMKKSEKLLEQIKEGMKKLFSTGFFHIFGSNVINKILGFLSSVLIVRLISKPEYGIYTVALNRLSFFLLLSGMGMVSAVLQLCSENTKNEVKSLAIYKYGAGIGTNFNILLGCAIVAASFILPNKVEGANEILLWLAFIPLFEIVNEFQKVYFRSRLNNQSFAYSNTIGAFFSVLCAVVGAVLGQIKGLVIGRYLAAIITTIITLVFLKGPVCLKPVSTPDVEKNILYKISFISMLNGGISELLYLFDVLVIGEVMGVAEAVADYKIAIIIPTALIFIPASICIYIYPYFSMNKENGIWLRKNFRLLIITMGAVNLAISVIMILFAPYIIKIAFGEQYITAVSMFRISAVNYFFTGTFRIISGNLLVTQRKLKFNFMVSVVSGILNVIGNFVLVNAYGAVGAAWTTLAISVTSGLVSTIYFNKVIDKKE